MLPDDDPPMLKLPEITLIPLGGAVLLLAGCGPVDDRVEITEERVLPTGHEAPLLGKSFEERMTAFQDKMTPPATESGAGAGLADLFEWEMPEGWEEARATRMRVINLTFGENSAGECYLTILGGGGGGLAANVGRWYGQMGMDAPTAEELAALPRATLMNRSAVVIDLTGTFTPMGGSGKEDYRLVGRILPQQTAGDSQFSMFLKMTGPEDLVAENLEKFEQFCDSLAPKRDVIAPE